MNTTKPLSLKARALRLLAQREHSRFELERKLAPHSPEDGAALAALLDALQAKGWIDDGRVAESVLHRRAAGLGRQRLRAELQAKGLAPEVVAGALEGLAATEWQRAQAVWAKRFGQAPSSPQERAKQMRFLAARGFGAEVVQRVLAGKDGPDPGP